MSVKFSSLDKLGQSQNTDQFRIELELCRLFCLGQFNFTQFSESADKMSSSSSNTSSDAEMEDIKSAAEPQSGPLKKYQVLCQ